MNNALRGAIFFSRFLPSFTALGHQVRSLRWQQTPLNFQGQRWLVTGASDGIGREIARQAAAAGAEVHAVGRSHDKLEALKQSPGAWATHAQDLSIMSNVSDFATHLKDQQLKFDVLVNNVGLMLSELNLTSERLEASFATNVLGHYVLTEELRNNGMLENGVIINMSSGGMYNVPLTLERLQGGPNYDGMLTYAFQKRAQISLNQWWRQQGERSYVMHPGWVDTPGVQTAMPEFRRVTGPLLRSVGAGADTALWLAMQQPSQQDNSKIWFDRALRSAHIFNDTQEGATVNELIDYLDTQLQTASSSQKSSATQTLNAA